MNEHNRLSASKATVKSTYLDHTHWSNWCHATGPVSPKWFCTRPKHHEGPHESSAEGILINAFWYTDVEQMC